MLMMPGQPRSLYSTQGLLSDHMQDMQADSHKAHDS